MFMLRGSSSSLSEVEVTTSTYFLAPLLGLEGIGGNLEVEGWAREVEGWAREVEGWAGEGAATEGAAAEGAALRGMGMLLTSQPPLEGPAWHFGGGRALTLKPLTLETKGTGSLNWSLLLSGSSGSECGGELGLGRCVGDSCKYWSMGPFTIPVNGSSASRPRPRPRRRFGALAAAALSSSLSLCKLSSPVRISPSAACTFLHLPLGTRGILGKRSLRKVLRTFKILS